MRRALTLFLVALLALVAAGNPVQHRRLPGSPYILDSVTGEVHAWSVAAVQRAAYSGELFRVRRSSDNTEEDIGRNMRGLLDTAELLAFCGAGNGFVVTIYDQVGSQNLTQATTGQQPQIVSSGALITDSGGKPAMQFDDSDDVLLVGNGGTPSAYPVSIVTFADPTAGGTLFTPVVAASSNQYVDLYIHSTAGEVRAMSRNTSVQEAIGTTDLVSASVRRMISGVYASTTDRRAFVGTSQEGSTSTGSSTWPTMTRMAIGRLERSSPADPYGGLISDVFYFNTALDGTALTTLSAWE